jgi:hypothetical protein
MASTLIGIEREGVTVLHHRFGAAKKTQHNAEIVTRFGVGGLVASALS